MVKINLKSLLQQMKRIHLIVIVAVVLVWIEGVSATSVDRLFITNQEGYPGDTITQEIQLTGNLPDRIGHWRTSYKHVEGDDVTRMDIRSWITITPENYTLAPGEVKTFTVTIKIPEDAEPGLYGATTAEAGFVGHSDERRTYLVFEDADAKAVIESEGNVVYSGLLIPVSVKVLGKPNPLTPVIKFVQANLISVILFAIVVVLLVLLLKRKR